MKRSLLLVVLIGLSGCAQMGWEKPGSTIEEYRVDHYACEKDARQSGYFGGGIYGTVNMQKFFNSCMESKGYYMRKVQPGETTQK